MKKTLIVLLILAVAGGAFAQELTWSGIAETGVQVLIPEEGDETIGIHNDNDDKTSRARIQAAYDAGTYGAKVGIGTDFDGDGFGVYNAYAWYNFLGGVINAKGGVIDDAVWNTDGPEDWNLSNEIGVRLEVAPLQGLNIGLVLSNSAESLSDVADDFLLETAVGFSYTSETFYISAALKFDSEADLTGDYSDDVANPVINEYVKLAKASGLAAGVPDDKLKEAIINAIQGEDPYGIAAYLKSSGLGSLPPTDKGVQAIFGFAYKGLPALTAKAEGHIWTLGKFSDYGFVWLNEDIGYQVMDPLKVGATLTEKFYGDSDVGKPYFKIKPYAEYQINEPLSVGIEIPLWFQQDAIDFSFGAKPWIKYTFAEDAYVKAFYDIARNNPKVGDGSTNQTIQIDFVVSF
jgi:hypothetical protein